ncbi:MAG: putative membrane protein [Polyangiales bacterium]
MDDILFLAGGAFFCVLPVGLIIAAAMRGGRLKELQRLLAEHDAALHSLGDQNVRLHQRLLALETSTQVATTPAQTTPAAGGAFAYAAAAPGAPPPEQSLPAAPASLLEPTAGQRWQPGPSAANPGAQSPSLSGQDGIAAAAAAVAGAAGAAGAAASAAYAAPPVSPPPTSPPLTTPAPAPKKPIQWEELLGVRGAAAVGAMVLVLAGLYFFKLSIDKNWVTPAMRFAIGMAVGVGCIAVAELRLRKRYVVLSNWLTGAGISVLYVSAWAGKALYDLYPSALAALLMAAVTAACVVLAQARKSTVVAVLGLCGGFITPMALSTGQDHPIPLFGYLLILNAAMLYMSYRQKWPWLAALALTATVLYEFGWLFGRMHDGTRWVGALALSLFAVLYLLVPLGGSDSKGWRRIRGAAVIIPLLLSIAIGLRTDLSAHLGVTALQLIALGAAAAWLGRREQMSTFAAAAAVACHAGLIGTVLFHMDTALSGWVVAGISLALCVVFQIAAEFGEEEKRKRAAYASAASVVGAVLLSFPMMSASLAAVPAAVVFGVFPAIFACRLNVLTPKWTVLHVATMAFGAVVVASLFISYSGAPGLPRATTNLGVMVLLAFAAQLAGLLTRKAPLAVRRAGDHGAAVVSVILGLGVAWVMQQDVHPALPFHLSRVLLLVATIFAAARTGLGGWLCAAALFFAFGDLALATNVDHGQEFLLVGMVIKVVLIAVSPFVFPKLRADRWAWRAAGTSGLVYLLPLYLVFTHLFGSLAVGLLPLSVSILYIMGAFLLRIRPAPVEVSLSATVWFVGAAAALITIAIPMQLENEWVTIGWALEAMVFSALWRRYDHTGLKYTALALASFVFIRLALNPEVLDYQLRGSWRLVNWISYTYLLPAAALFGAHALMGGKEVQRRRKWEPGPIGKPLVAPIFGGFAIVLIFVWLNLMVFDFFATGPNLTIPTDRLAARDLSTSMVWAVYAIGLLVGGVVRKSKGLRYASLTLLLFTGLKVFLYDLGNLEDLYRVASLVGLALTLIVISLFYKRFVFSDEEAPTPAAPTGPSPSPTSPAPPAQSAHVTPPGGPEGSP